MFSSRFVLPALLVGTFVGPVSACAGDASGMDGGGTGTGGGGGGTGGASGSPGPYEPGLVPRTSANVFFSGHSLVNMDMPRMFDVLTESLDRTARYQSQVRNGAAMRARLEEPTLEQNRDGSAPLGFSILEEIPQATTIGAGQRYDTLVVTEAVPLINHVLYSQSVANAGRFYDLVMQNGPASQAFLYEVWDSVSGGDYTDWVARMRTDRVMWECIASKVNLAPGRAERPMRIVPGAQALATLVEAVQAGEVTGVNEPGALFTDDIHLSALGNYFIALVQHATLYGASPVGATHAITDPWGGAYPGLSNAATAQRLQEMAWSAVQGYFADDGPRTMQACREEFLGRTTNPHERNDIIPAVFAD